MLKTKKFYGFGEDKPPIIYRPGTSDESIIKTVFIDQQEYMFPNPEVLDPKKIFDIGANIGVVAVILAHVYPGATVHAFEPEDENYELLKLNVAGYPNVKTYHAGLGNKPETRSLFKSDNPVNLGGFSTHIEGKGEIAAQIQILRSRTIFDSLGPPDLIKIDCEGAEYEILNDATNLKGVKFITGELHGINDYLTLDLLKKHGFDLQHSRAFGSPVWHFSAWNLDFLQGLNGPDKVLQPEKALSTESA